MTDTLLSVAKEIERGMHAHPIVTNCDCLICRLRGAIAREEQSPLNAGAVRRPHSECAGAVSYPDKPVGHYGAISQGMVICSWCHHRTPTTATPPFSIVCGGCLRNVRVES